MSKITSYLKKKNTHWKEKQTFVDHFELKKFNIKF